MKHLQNIILGLAALVLVYFGFFNIEKAPTVNSPLPQSSSDASQQINQSTSSGQTWETKTDDQPPVSVKITPIEFGKDAKQWRFDIIFDTHAGSLDDDTLAVATLMDNEGTVYRAISWEGPGPGGHHREGTLIFHPVQPVPEYIELRIRDVGGIPERSFRWDL